MLDDLRGAARANDGPLQSGSACGDVLCGLEGYSVQRYSQRQIKNAGKIIAAYNPHPPSEEVRLAFQTAQDWRDAHIVPLKSARAELRARARSVAEDPKTPGRLKRFQSIRAKLRRRPLSLYSMQDIAGCRAIVATMDEVDEIAAIYRGGGSKHAIVGEDNYIEAPKAGGYRSIHFMLKYAGDETMTGGNRLTVEVQIRTVLQHAWATAVEAVGTVRNEGLKGGVGDRDWLRFFELMAAEFAVEEKRPIVPTVSTDAGERLAELRELERRLDAVTTLESYNRAISRVNQFGALPGGSFLILFNSVDRSVTVRANPSFRQLAAQYQEAERNESSNAVMVEVDRVDDLVAAYPNYFLDVQMFTDRLRATISGRPAAQIGPPDRSAAWLAAWVMRGRR